MSSNSKTHQILLTVNQCAKLLNVSAGYIRNSMANGSLTYFKIGRKGHKDAFRRDRRIVRIPASALDELKEIFHAEVL